ncbi:chymotrypsin inhibitor-like isoform X1 [Cotesia glomerata]|uniref:chymotrypsin inhibitor-like isoform X1 n=1 Tax=Cotesia glomerata TaxID=32391 RepID=UPI001D0165C5|nr:chymotrypsin inhibitor-like isoform X1 [Cotesia glomerata]
MSVVYCKLIFLNVLIAYLHVLYKPGLTMAYSDGGCGPNAEWKSCGSACAPTCESPNQLGVCIAVCVSGCFCEEGYLRESDGTCVQECKSRS